MPTGEAVGVARSHRVKGLVNQAGGLSLVLEAKGAQRG